MAGFKYKQTGPYHAEQVTIIIFLVECVVCAHCPSFFLSTVIPRLVIPDSRLVMIKWTFVHAKLRALSASKNTNNKK